MTRPLSLGWIARRHQRLAHRDGCTCGCGKSWEQIASEYAAEVCHLQRKLRDCTKELRRLTAPTCENHPDRQAAVQTDSGIGYCDDCRPTMRQTLRKTVGA
jgi:hypothetical protein